MCVLRTSLHLIAILWKKLMWKELFYFLLVRPIFYVFVFLFIMESHLCVLRLIFDKDSKGSWSSCGTFCLSSSLLFDALPPRLYPPWPPSSPVFSIQIFARMFMVPLSLAAAWKPPEGRELQSHQVWCVCSPSLEEPSPGTLTLPAVQGLRTGSYFVQLSNSQ